jgi:hypothetical protein
VDERCLSGDGSRVVCLLSSANGVPAQSLDKSHRGTKENLGGEMLAYYTLLYTLKDSDWQKLNGVMWMSARSPSANASGERTEPAPRIAIREP